MIVPLNVAQSDVKLHYDVTHENNNVISEGIDIKDLTPVRGQDGKISDTQGKDFWSPTMLRRVDATPSWRPIEIFPAGV